MTERRAFVGPLVREQREPPPGRPRVELCSQCQRACWQPIMNADDVPLCRECGIRGSLRFHGPLRWCDGLVRPLHIAGRGNVPAERPESLMEALEEAFR